jgi:hypothetical protein
MLELMQKVTKLFNRNENNIDEWTVFNIQAVGKTRREVKAVVGSSVCWQCFMDI